jgi:hypothetical protein
MTETETPQYADYYQCAAGLTIGMNVCAEGEVVEGSAMNFSEGNPPLSEEQQVKQYGQVMYKEYTPEEDEVAPIHSESTRIRAMMGMQSPDMPPVNPVLTSEAPLDTLSRQELRKKAKLLGLNFPEDTDRDQMLGAIEKKQRENAEGEGGDENEPEVVKQRRQHAKEAIESNNELAAGGSGGGPASAAPRRSRSTSTEAPPEEEVR